jgi:protein-disulfide isomerase
MLVTPVFVMFAALAAGPDQKAPASRSAADHVEIVLYSDFQCPYCAQLAPAIRQLETEPVDGVSVTIEFRNFPLSIHPNAQLAHQAAMAAKAQGKFWEMHDLLFANQRKVQRNDLLGYAKALGLDRARFERDLDSHTIKQLIAADVADGNRLGITGTPTFTINGTSYTGTRPFNKLKDLITRERWRARALAEITDEMTSKGRPDAPVTLELFLDLQSPVSAPALDVVDQLLLRYPSAVRVQFRNFPLAFHPDAPLAHEAAMTAAREGRFWEFAGFILKHQNTLREQDLIGFAGQLGLDEEKFAEAIQQHRYAARVDADLQAGAKRSLRGSPVVVVGSARIDGVPTLQRLTEYVEAALKGQPGRSAERP